MKRIPRIMFFALIASVILAVNCGRGLRSSIESGFGPFTFKAPYLNTVNFFGFVAEGIRPDGQMKGKDAYFIYFWVPAIIDEVGVAMVSPSDMEPGKNDFKHPMYDQLKKAHPSDFFDTYIFLERLSITDSAKIKNGGAPVSLLAEDDDSSELPAQPDGRRYNSLLRHKSEAASPTKALVRGVYRIAFTSYRGKVFGSYVATVGTNLPGVKIAATLDELHNLVNAK